MESGLHAQLAAEGIHVHREWVAQLQQWAQSEGLAANLLEVARDQVRSADLREIGASPLPDLFDQTSHGKILAGPFVIQLEGWLEVSKARAQSDGLVDVEGEAAEADQGLLGLRRQQEERDDAEELGVGPRGGRRMLKLKCSDGKQDVFAFEYAQVPQLPLTEGAKLILRNVKVMRGLLALTPANVVVLGGAWEKPAPVDDATSQTQQQQSPDAFDVDLEAIAALERAAMQQRQPAVAPMQSSSSPSSQTRRKKKKKRRFLDDSE